ncbi:hypothetical protein PMI33_02413 [Pseudomonas sp. GM67]|jgi:hypothetical protein|nr:hypothetical protein PMI33_02413 [Pseudomonas sp. GM67]
MRSEPLVRTLALMLLIFAIGAFWSLFTWFSS